MIFRKINNCPICKTRLVPFEAKRRNILLAEKDFDCIKNYDAMIYFCPKCLSFHNIEAYYVDESKQKEGSDLFYSIDSSTVLMNLEAYLELLKNLFSFVNVNPEGKDFLDVGCGQGASLYAAKKIGCDRVIGVDIAVRNYNLFCNEISKTLSGWRPEFYTSCEDVKGKVDFILCWHTLEHIKTPIKFIKNLSSKLKSGGFIFIQVPQYVEEYITFVHVIFYSLPSIKYLCHISSLNLVMYANDAVNQFSTFILKKN